MVVYIVMVNTDESAIIDGVYDSPEKALARVQELAKYGGNSEDLWFENWEVL